MRLTRRILEAIVQMSARVEAGDVEDYTGYSDAPYTTPDGKQHRPNPSGGKEYQDAIDAGDWARQQLRKRSAKKERRPRVD